KDEILKFSNSGLLDIYDKSGYVSEKDLKSGEEKINNEEITKVLVTDNETITPSYNVSTNGVKEYNNGENYNYYGGISNLLPEETITKSSGDYKIDKSEQSPSVVDDLTVISARDENEKDSKKENRKQDRNNEGINSGASKQKEIIYIEPEVDIARNKEESISDGDVDYNNGNIAYAPAGTASGQEISTSHFETISFARIEEKPVFPGGFDALIKFVEENINYPVLDEADSQLGKVIVSFIIDTAGYVTDVTILKGVNPAYDTEAVRVIKMLPRWTPGKLNGKPVNVSFVYPVDFKTD
ncbi:MAG TPA: energy transducer TonB, partial [Bacteroidales bacterium]|nr:energy transducer TonB [Bacteroidales bacterium]